MKRVIFLIMVGVFAISASAIAQDEMPDADALWKHISVSDPYTKWGYFPDHKGMQMGNAPHGRYNVVFVNERAGKAGHPKAEGAIIVKENYTPDKELAAITVMKKIKGYSPGAGDWFWVKYAPDGKVLMAGKPKGCIACHRAAVDSDFIMVSTH